jgi:replicative DNA helicase
MNIINKNIKQKEALRDYNGSDCVVSSYEIQERLKQSADSFLVIKTGLPTIDGLTEGFEAGELCVIAGPTGQGKTLLAQTITKYLCGKKQFPMWLSFEMPPRQFLESFPIVPYFYMPQELKAYDLKWLRDRCWENEVKHGGQVVIIDHLHFLLHKFNEGNPALQIGRLVAAVKDLARTNGYVIFLLAHTAKIAEGQHARLRDIRDSGLIACEADDVLIIQRIIDQEKQENQAFVTVDKCRKTGVFGKQVKVQKIGGYLQELVFEQSVDERT